MSHVLIIFFQIIVIVSLALVPDSSSVVPSPPVLTNLFLPYPVSSIVGVDILSAYPEENMVIDPFGDWAHAICMEDLRSGISHQAVASAPGPKSKAVHSVDCKRVSCPEFDNQSWPLGWLNWNSAIGFFNVANRSLRARWESCNEQIDTAKGAPGAWK